MTILFLSSFINLPSQPHQREYENHLAEDFSGVNGQQVYRSIHVNSIPDRSFRLEFYTLPGKIHLGNTVTHTWMICHDDKDQNNLRSGNLTIVLTVNRICVQSSAQDIRAYRCACH